MRLVAYRNTMRNAKPVVDDGCLMPAKRRSIQWMRERAEETPLLTLVPKQEPKPLPKLEPPRPTPVAEIASHPRRIIAQVAAWHGMPFGDVVGRSHKRPTVAARHDAIVAIYINCRIDGRRYSMPELGRLFKRDHTTILSVFNKFGLDRRKPGTKA
jgi:hypothetical protein